MAHTVADPTWVGWRGLVHGGILIAMMDEAMGWAVARAGWTALTGRLQARLRAPVAPGARLCVRGWVVEWRRTVARTRAEVVASSGRPVASAEALCYLTRDLPPAAP